MCSFGFNNIALNVVLHQLGSGAHNRERSLLCAPARIYWRRCVHHSVHVSLTNHTVFFVKTGLNALETRYFIIIYKIIYFLAKINHLTCGG